MGQSKQSGQKYVGLQNRFLLGLAIILIIFSAFAAGVIYFYDMNAIEDEAFQKTEIVMAAVGASRKYVRGKLRPRMYEVVGEDDFVLEAMSSSYVSRAIMDYFKEEMPDFEYRRVAVNARNPLYEASEHEQEMIRYFRDNPDLEEWRGIIRTEGRQYFMRYQPVWYVDSCGRCHGSPEDAPKSILVKYGDRRGFNNGNDQVNGLVSVSIPVDIGLAKTREIAFSVFGIVLLSAFFLFGIITFFFNRLVVQNIREVLGIFRDTFQDERSEEFSKNLETREEIAELTILAKGMAEHLRETRARLTENKDILQSVFDGITDLVALVDSNGRFIMVNRAFLLRYSLALEEIVGHPVHDPDEPAGHPFGDAVMMLGSADWEEKSDYVHGPDGTIFEVHFYPILDNGGEVINVVCYAKDVTEQKNIEQRMYHTEKLLALGQMAAGVAHEINNPLGVILCYTDILKDDLAGSPQVMKDIEIIEKHARSCQHIISDLLDFARGGKTVRKQVHLNSLIEEVLTVVRTQLRKENIRILTDLSSELPPLSLDADKMKQTLINLVINGAQAIIGSGEIGIYTVYLEKRGLVQLIVEDNGCGVPGDIIGKIFDPFFTTKEKGQGTGLGLSLAYGIVQDHGGEIRVESEPGSWTRFTVSLPVPIGTAE